MILELTSNLKCNSATLTTETEIEPSTVFVLSVVCYKLSNLGWQSAFLIKTMWKFVVVAEVFRFEVSQNLFNFERVFVVTHHLGMWWFFNELIRNRFQETYSLHICTLTHIMYRVQLCNIWKSHVAVSLSSHFPYLLAKDHREG
jgi:hypothetical protein